MLALPESECQEILALFRKHLPHVPDAWLQELAANYGLNAVVDIDPNDVIAILSAAGQLHRIQISLAQDESLANIHRSIHEQLIELGVASRQVVASLIAIQNPSAKMEEVGKFIGLIINDCVNSIQKGWGWYESLPPCHLERKISWIICSR